VGAAPSEGPSEAETCIVFCETKVRCGEVAALLCREGADALALHGDLEQSERERVSGATPFTKKRARGLGGLVA
jgi:superfamily II DNA/RNA helicase